VESGATAVIIIEMRNQEDQEVELDCMGISLYEKED
jgi:hypothetical protein